MKKTAGGNACVVCKIWRATVMSGGSGRGGADMAVSCALAGGGLDRVDHFRAGPNCNAAHFEI